MVAVVSAHVLFAGDNFEVVGVAASLLFAEVVYDFSRRYGAYEHGVCEAVGLDGLPVDGHASVAAGGAGSSPDPAVGVGVDVDAGDEAFDDVDEVLLCVAAVVGGAVAEVGGAVVAGAA